MSLDICPIGTTLPSTDATSLATTREVEAAMMEMPQVSLENQSMFHAGLYARTIRIPAGVAITGALIKIPTVLIVSGVMRMTAGDQWIDANGFACFKCPAWRKQIMVAKTDCFVTMAFATNAVTEREAEDEFTDEGDLLMSRKKEDLA